MTPGIAPPAGRNNILRFILTTVLARQQMLGGAAVGGRGPRLRPQIGWTGQPHEPVAVVAAARLGKEREGA